MKYYRKKDKTENRGFSLFTVIVAVAFVGIMSILIIYISMSNFYMKVTDLKGKDSFYTAEQALEEIRTGLQEDVGEAMSSAYIKVLENYSQDVTSQDVTLDEVRQSQFNELFVKLLTQRLQASGSGTFSTVCYDINKLNGPDYLDTKYSGDKTRFDEDKEDLIVTTIEGTEPQLRADLKNGVLLKNLKVVYVDEKGHASIIETDIRLSIPKVEFRTPTTLPDLMNMIVVANGGIICEGDKAAGKNEIKGNIYAGLLNENSLENAGDMPVSILVKPGCSLTISDGNKAVCQGNISVRNGSEFTSREGVALWAEGLTLASSNVELLGKTYFSDDLTVETGSGSNVTVKGEYYGYGSENSANAPHNNAYYEDTTKYKTQSITGGDLSSAIVINGKNTTVDLSGVQKLMLSGRNYISTSKVTPYKDKKNDRDLKTGESITVKGAQLAYLVPAELIGNGTKTNPMSADDFLTLGENYIQMNTPYDGWGGKTLNDLGLDQTQPVQPVYYNDPSNDLPIVYLYLNFTDDKSSEKYMKLFYQNYKNAENKTNFDKYLDFYFDKGILVNDPRAYTRYITNGNVLSYDDQTKQGRLDSATANMTSESGAGRTLLQEQINYQNTWYALNRKMIGSYELLNTSVKKSDGSVDHNETEYNRSVYDNLVNEEKLRQFITEKVNNGIYYSAPVSEDVKTPLSLILAKNDDRTLKINSASVTLNGIDTPVNNLRLVVCTGDVEISENVKFEGIIMTKGKITLKSGACLTSNSKEAARVFQADLTELSTGQPDQKISARDFFWDGDSYVLGNSISSGSSTDNVIVSDVFQPSDCITYENWKKK